MGFGVLWLLKDTWHLWKGATFDHLSATVTNEKAAFMKRPEDD